MPLLAPVTIATRPLSSPMSVISLTLRAGPHPRRELTPMPRLGSACPRLGMAAGANLFTLPLPAARAPCAGPGWRRRPGPAAVFWRCASVPRLTRRDAPLQGPPIPAALRAHRRGACRIRLASAWPQALPPRPARPRLPRLPVDAAPALPAHDRSRAKPREFLVRERESRAQHFVRVLTEERRRRAHGSRRVGEPNRRADDADRTSDGMLALRPARRVRRPADGSRPARRC